MRKITEQETFDFWYNNPEFDDHDQFGSNYYVNEFYKKIVFKLELPSEGYIVVAGTNRCVSFNLLCDYYGKSRCLGFDLYNPSANERVIQIDCLSLSENDDIPIAFAHNDVGSLSHTPDVKIHTHKWLSKNIVKNGYLLGNNNLNRAKFNFEQYMQDNGFENTHFSNLDKNTFDISGFPKERIEGYMLSRKNM
jgi:hypothetical protein